MSRSEINAIVNELAEIQLELKEDRAINSSRFKLFQDEISLLNQQDENLSFKLDRAIDRIKDLLHRLNSGK